MPAQTQLSLNAGIAIRHALMLSQKRCDAFGNGHAAILSQPNNATMSAISQSFVVTPAAIAGVVRSVWWTRTKL
jgi:hypothetical protein